MNVVLLIIELSVYSSLSARLKSGSHSATESLYVNAQRDTSFREGRFSITGSVLSELEALRSVRRFRDSLDEMFGKSMWLVVLALGIIIGWVCFSCWSCLLMPKGAASDDDVDNEGKPSSFAARFTRAVRSSVKNVMPQAIHDSEEDTEPERIILVETLYRVPSAGGRLTVTVETLDALELPDKFSGWEPVSCALVEATDGLYMCVADERSESKTRLVNWSGNPSKYLEVDILDQVTLLQDSPRRASRGRGSILSGVGDENEDPELNSPCNSCDAVQFNHHISMRAIPTNHKVVSVLHPFVVRWGEGSEKSYLLIAGEEEGTCTKWVKNLQLYADIEKRFDGALLWKLNASVVDKLPQSMEEAREFLADIRNWRRRLCFLEQLHTQKSLCITYLSEKTDDGAVANILAKAGQGTVASIQKMPPIPVACMTSWDSEHVRSNVLQYYISIFGSRHDQEAVLPVILHGFQVSLPESLAASGGHAHSVYAFDDAASLTSWLASMESAIQELGRETTWENERDHWDDLPPP